MTSLDAEDRTLRTGVHDVYSWLTVTGDVYMGTVLGVCPELVEGRYLAVTSMDSGMRRLDDREIEAGWLSRGGIAYSPRVLSAAGLKFQRDGLDSPGFDEWYAFEQPQDLGVRYDGNYFDFEAAPGRVMTFESMRAFVLHDPQPYLPGILDVFWRQMRWIRPQVYIADGEWCVTVVTAERALFDLAQRRLTQALLLPETPA